MPLANPVPPPPPHPFIIGCGAGEPPTILLMLSSLTFGLLNNAILSSLLIVFPFPVGKLGNEVLFNGLFFVGPVGKLTDRIIGPVSTGGDFELEPAPPVDQGVEWVVDLDDPPPPPNVGNEDVFVVAPGTCRPLTPEVAGGRLTG